MFKLFLSLTFAVGFASAATISTSVTCDGVTTVGTFSASCNSIGSFANADVTAPSFVDMFSGLFQLGVAATAIGDGPNESSSASANFSEDYVFTVSGGTGNGSFFPLFFRFGQFVGQSELRGRLLRLYGCSCWSHELFWQSTIGHSETFHLRCVTDR